MLALLQQADEGAPRSPASAEGKDDEAQRSRDFDCEECQATAPPSRRRSSRGSPSEVVPTAELVDSLDGQVLASQTFIAARISAVDAEPRRRGAAYWNPPLMPPAAVFSDQPLAGSLQLLCSSSSRIQTMPRLREVFLRVWRVDPCSQIQPTLPQITRTNSRANFRQSLEPVPGAAPARKKPAHSKAEKTTPGAALLGRDPPCPRLKRAAPGAALLGRGPPRPEDGEVCSRCPWQPSEAGESRR